MKLAVSRRPREAGSPHAHVSCKFCVSGPCAAGGTISPSGVAASPNSFSPSVLIVLHIFSVCHVTLPKLHFNRDSGGGFGRYSRSEKRLPSDSAVTPTGVSSPGTGALPGGGPAPHRARMLTSTVGYNPRPPLKQPRVVTI